MSVVEGPAQDTAGIQKEMEAETPAASTGGVDAIDLEGDCFSHKVWTLPARNCVRAPHVCSLPPSHLRRTPLQVLPISMEWSDISVTVRVGGMLKTKALKQILAPTSGSASPGDLLAIMGPSGSGKTTLLDALANRIASSKVEGTVTFNGSAFSASERHQHISYVAQDDSLLGVFTVTETLQQAARFCYGYSQSSAQLKAVIEEAIETVGLRSAAHTVVGDIFRKGLSGGQKRRLSLAVELVKKPSILIIDEPTSGLDSASAYGIMHNLTLLCKVGHTIVTTIHQPSSEIYQMFDQFMLLSRGKTLYSGPASGSVGHFSAMGYPCPEYNNPADFFLSLVNNDFPLHPCDLTAVESAYQSSAILKAALDKISSVRASPTPVLPGAAKLMGVGADFVTLCKRNLTNNMRNPGIYWVRFAMYTMLSLMIGFMYWDLGDARTASSITSRVSVLFFVAAFLVFMAVAVLPFFIMERPVFIRERSNGFYGVAAYAASNFVCCVPGVFLIALVSAACVVLPSGLNGFGVYVATLGASLFTAEAVMFLIASLGVGCAIHACSPLAARGARLQGPHTHAATLPRPRRHPSPSAPANRPTVPHYIIGIALGAGLFGFHMLCEGFFIVAPDIPGWFIWVRHATHATPSSFVASLSPPSLELLSGG